MKENIKLKSSNELEPVNGTEIIRCIDGCVLAEYKCKCCGAKQTVHVNEHNGKLLMEPKCYNKLCNNYGYKKDNIVPIIEEGTILSFFASNYYYEVTVLETLDSEYVLLADASNKYIFSREFIKHLQVVIKS